ncbi:MAG: plasmid mobilization protein [Bryobacteraceae bacterium]
MSDQPTEKQEGTCNRKVYPRVYSRVSVAERDRIKMDADAHGLTVGSYLRWLAIDRPETRAVRRPLPDEKLLAQLKGAAGRVDGNIAQLLKLANRGDIVDVEELADAAKAVRDFYRAALELLKGDR